MSSPNNTYAVGIGATVTDASGNVYVINSNGQITVNGKVDRTTARVDALGYANGVVWQKNADNFWYSKSTVTARWANYNEVNGVPPIQVPGSGNGSSYTPGSAFPLQDTDGNSWIIDTAGKVVVDGSVDRTTDRVIKLEYVSGVVWQENADGNWYSKVKPSDTWTQATRADPVTAALASTLTWTGASADPTQAAAWTLPDGSHHVPVPHEALVMNAGTMNLGSGNLAGDALSGNVGTVNMSNGGSLKLETGTATVHVTGGGAAALNITSNGVPSSSAEVIVTADQISSVVLNAQMSFGRLTETGGTVVVNGTSHFSGVQVLLTSNLTGTGTLDVTYNRAAIGVLEVNGAIGSGVTLATESPNSTLILDNAPADHGTVRLHYGSLEVKNVAATDSVSYRDSMVSLYQGDRVLASIKVIGVAGQTGFGPNDGTLHFGKNAAGSVFVYETYLGGALTPLPLHV